MSNPNIVLPIRDRSTSGISPLTSGYFFNPNNFNDNQYKINIDISFNQFKLLPSLQFSPKLQTKSNHSLIENGTSTQPDIFDSWTHISIIPELKSITDVPENRMQAELTNSLQDKTFTLSQREFGIIRGNSKYSVIGTYNLGPNVALVGYEENLKVAFVAHFDINTKLEIDIFINKLPKGVYQSYIIGGLTGYSEIIIEGIFRLTKLIPGIVIQLCGRCILGSVYDPKSIFINRHDGQIYTFSGPILDPDFWNRGNIFTHRLIKNITPLQYIKID